jgi:large subunit ribosomal protein L13Ae
MTTHIIDGKGHLMGRLASICAKELLEGKKIIILRCEKIEKSGKHIRNKLNFILRYKKRTHTNPKHGPFHFKTPSQVFWKTIRGMLPHKTYRGSLALKRLKLYDGVPVALAKRKKFIVPCALRLIKLAPGRKYSKIGEIFNEIGWNKKKIIEENEEKSKALGKKFWKNKFRLVQQLKKNKRNFNKSTNLKVFAH